MRPGDPNQPGPDLLAHASITRQEPWSAVCAVSIFFACLLQFIVFSFGRDQSIYAVLGDGILHGKLPYRDLWDFKPPGIFFVYAFAQALFGTSMLAPRIFEMLGLCLLGASFVFLAKRWFGSRLLGIWAAALAVFIHSQLDFWHTSQPETYGAILTALGLALAVHEENAKRPAVHWIAIGLVFGLAGLMKPHLLAGGTVVAAYLATRQRQHIRASLRYLLPILTIGTAALVPILATCLWFWSKGAWAALKWTLFEFAPGYTALTYQSQSALRLFYAAVEEASFRFSAIVAVGLVLAFALAPEHRREREGLFVLLGVCMVHFAGIAMQSKFYQYHFSATLPFLSLIATLGFGKLWFTLKQPGRQRAAIFVVGISSLASMRVATNDVPLGYWARASERLRFLVSQSSYANREQLDAALYHVAGYSLVDNQQISRTVAQLTKPDDSIFVWGFEPAIYLFSKRAPASRFIYNVPQRAAWQGKEARSMLLGDLKRRPPQVIVVERRDIFPSVVGNALDSAASLEQFVELSTLIRDGYSLARQTERFDVYQKTQQSASLAMPRPHFGQAR